MIQGDCNRKSMCPYVVNDEGWRPVGNRVLIKCDENTVSSGGLWMAHKSRSLPRTGTVMARGAGERTKKGGWRYPEVHVGDRVIFHPCKCTEVWVGDELHVMVHGEDVLGRLVEE